MAPELWAEHEKEYDSSVDMWAIGVVTFMLLSGKRPFHHQDRERKAMMIKHDKLSFHSQAGPALSPPSPKPAQGAGMRRIHFPLPPSKRPCDRPFPLCRRNGITSLATRETSSRR